MRLPSSWHFKQKAIPDDEAKDFLRVLFHETSHFHHLIGTTYGVYYYVSRFTQLVSTFMSLHDGAAKNKMPGLPISNGFCYQIRDMFEGFLDCLEVSSASDLVKKTNLDTVIAASINSDRRNELCGKEKISLPRAIYAVEDEKGDYTIPFGAHAIMENYAKQLEHMNGLAHSSAPGSYEKHFYYYFLTFQILMMKDVPDKAKNTVLSSIYYISLMGLTPVITNPYRAYFGTSLKPESFNQLGTLKELRSPALIFFDALKATKEISKNEPDVLNDQNSFLCRLCEKLNLPDVDKLNLQLKRFICFVLEEYKKQPGLSSFPFVEFYLQMSLKFVEIFSKDPLAFINGEITKKTVFLLTDPLVAKGISGGFLQQYPVPSVLVEHTYDKSGRISEHTGLGDSGQEQLFLELYWDLYEQLFENNYLYCYGARHLSSSGECVRLNRCEPGKTRLDYADCSQFHRSLLNTIFG